MRQLPTDDYERANLDRLQPLPWQLPLLGLNPDYTCWGPYEDYMAGSAGRWNQPQILDTWEEFNAAWGGLDEYNEIVNFYFSLERDSRKCDRCEDGYHPDARWIVDSFYNHSSPFAAGQQPTNEVLARYGQAFTQFCQEIKLLARQEWHLDITEDEVQALIAENRVPADSTAAQINQNYRTGLGHDGINRSILIRRRCERLGVPLTCRVCGGQGYQYTSPNAHVELTLWFIHPRKGCSRGVQVKLIEEKDLEAVVSLLREAADRNAQRFQKVVQIPVVAG